MPGVKLRKNKYDSEITEYWVDARTAGVKGQRDEEALRETASIQGQCNEAPDLRGSGTPIGEWCLNPGNTPCEEVSGNDKATRLFEPTVPALPT